MGIAGQIRDIAKNRSHEAKPGERHNVAIHLASLASTKTGDGLLDTKLVLPWLMQAVGAPSAAIGLLVPVRESLALLPQIFASTRVNALRRRKWVWSGASALQAFAVAMIALTLWRLDGALAGWLTVLLLAVFAFGRSFASLSYKAVLGSTVAKGRRGSVTGLAGSLAAGVILAYGAALATGLLPVSATVLLSGIAVAAVLWAIAALLFARLREEPDGDAASGGRASLRDNANRLLRDRRFMTFVAVRALLTATALAPPYLLLSAGEENGRSLGALGAFVIASSLAAILGSTVWGLLSDRSSRMVLVLAALAGSLVLAASAWFAWTMPDTAVWRHGAPVALFVLMLAYQGVRLGRSTHLVDMATDSERTLYTAFSNTLIGIVLIAMGAFGLVAEAFGPAFVLACFAAFCALAIPLALSLDEVQRDA